MKIYTLSYVAKVLQRAGYPITERQLRNWVDKEMLPHPTSRGLGRGKGKVYFWTQRTIIKQAATVWELLCWYGRMHPIPFMLWLLGHDMPLSVVRQALLRWVEGGRDQLLEGIDPQDAEQVADRLSSLAVQAHQRRKRGAAARSRAAQEELLELYLNVQFNPQYQPSESVLGHLAQEMSITNQSNLIEQGETPLSPEVRMELAQGMLRFLQQFMSQARLSQALTTASDEQLQQVQKEFGRMLHVVCRLLAYHFREQDYWLEVKYNALHNLGRYVVPWMLALRREGYGHWIDQALEWVDIFETAWRTDPLFRHAIQQGDMATAIPRLPFFATSSGPEVADVGAGQAGTDGSGRPDAAADDNR
ncbi:MAG TPA: hypothetical protein VFV38_32315 [Ktedonobacteraceae bacterium]|nr:hypothetical protein [Ktedonobacteraceae bacterium]